MSSYLLSPDVDGHTEECFGAVTSLFVHVTVKSVVRIGIRNVEDISGGCNITGNTLLHGKSGKVGV